MDLQRLKIDRKSEPPRERAASTKSSFPLGKLVLLAAVGGAAWLFKDPIVGVVDSLRLPRVETAEVVRRSPAAAGAIAGASANGYIIARVRAALSADTPGRIVELNVVEGQYVAKDFVVARLYSKEYEAALAAAESDVNATIENLGREQAALTTFGADVRRLAAERDAQKAVIGEAEADVTLWTIEVARAKELLETGAEMPRVLDQATAALQTARARVTISKARAEAAAAELAQGEARLEEQKLIVRTVAAQVETKKALRDEAAARLDKTIIRAPFDGVVVLKDAEIGEVVSPNVQAGGNARGSVVTMVDFASLEMQAKVPEASLGMVKEGAPATVFLDAYPGFPYSATVDRIWPTADKKEGTIEVRARFHEPDDKLRPEMQARIVFGADANATAAGEVRPDVLLVPQRAIVRTRVGDTPKTAVYVLERDRAVERFILTDQRIGDSVVVANGLSDGEVVILDPPASMTNGSRVLRANR